MTSASYLGTVDTVPCSCLDHLVPVHLPPAGGEVLLRGEGWGGPREGDSLPKRFHYLLIVNPPSAIPLRQVMTGVWGQQPLLLLPEPIGVGWEGPRCGGDKVQTDGLALYDILSRRSGQPSLLLSVPAAVGVEVEALKWSWREVECDWGLNLVKSWHRRVLVLPLSPVNQIVW